MDKPTDPTVGRLGIRARAISVSTWQRGAGGSSLEDVSFFPRAPTEKLLLSSFPELFELCEEEVRERLAW